MNKRNVAIIAHVDHGKTSIVNEILKESLDLRENEDLSKINMDSNDIEKERGITILAKTTSINYNGYHINILDTPGHADFGGEVERIMNMVDGVILVVDAYEGTMPQTRFVLKKALDSGAKPIVLINKVDKESARCAAVLDEVLELFIDLGATDEQIDFPVVYASALNGTTSFSDDIKTQEAGFAKVLDLIIKDIPEPKVELNADLQMQVTLLDYNEYVGRMGTCLIRKGHIKTGQMVEVITEGGAKKSFRVQKLFGYIGLTRVELDEAEAGDIVSIAGYPDILVGDTIGLPGKTEVLPRLHIDEPTLEMTFGVNSSPFSGKEGDLLTAKKIKDRLYKEAQKDVSLKVVEGEGESFEVSGRGELHLGILIENMRREGFELEISKPKVILKEENGVTLEPFEDLLIEVPSEYSGSVIEYLGQRGAELIKLEGEGDLTRLSYLIPSRGLIGFATTFMTMTKGYGVMNASFKEYKPFINLNLGERKLGVLVSIDQGKATAYSLNSVEDRGVMFIEPGTEVYEGMIVGEHSRDNDLAVNVTKGKNLTNVRAAGSDNTVVLKRPRPISLEYALDYINSDELVEVTPKSIRLRKKILNADDRRRAMNHKA